MSDIKISELTTGGTLQAGDAIPAVRGGNNISISVSAGSIGFQLLTKDTTAAAQSLMGLTTANQLTAFSSAAANYSFAASAESVSFTNGNSPTLTINAAGTYIIMARADILYNGATTVADRSITMSLKRMNNSPGTLANSTIIAHTGVVTTLTSSMPGASWWCTYTTSNANDIINMIASITTVPSAGTLDITNASLIAYRLQQ